MKRLAITSMLMLTLALVACGHGAVPVANHPTDTSRAQANAAAQAPSPSAAIAAAPSADLSAAAETQQEGADTGTGADRGELALERVASLSPVGLLPGGKWIAGTHYQVLAPAQPTDVPPGKVEVLEFFWYGCPHCYELDPMVERWLDSKPAYVEFKRVPVLWANQHEAYARLFYSLQVLGQLDALHGKLFEEIQRQHDPLWVQGEDDRATLSSQLRFLKANGVNEADFLKAYHSPEVQNDVQQAGDLNRRYGISYTPTFVVNGKYESGAGMAGGDANLINLVNDLAVGERPR